MLVQENFHLIARVDKRLYMIPKYDCFLRKIKYVYYVFLYIKTTLFQVAGEREVKAQIKLRFRNAAGKPIVITRSLSLTQKPNKQECKSIDSALQTFSSTGEVWTLLIFC